MNKIVTAMIIGVLTVGASVAIAATCQKSGTGNASKCTDPTHCYTCPNCPTCVDSSSQSKCVVVCALTPFGNMAPVTTQCGPCNTYPGPDVYLQMPTYQDATDTTCTPHS